jgi:beta-lactamase class A
MKLDCDLNPHARPPMQSVFKLELAVTALHLVEQGRFALDQMVRFLPGDRILPSTVSPLQAKYPGGDVDVPLREILRLAVVEGDNVAADIGLRIVGGPEVVSRYIKELGASGFQLKDNEAAMHRDPKLQYRNWFEPAGAVQFLRRLSEKSPLNAEHTALVLSWMRDTTRAPNRIKGDLPLGTNVMHRAGASSTRDGFTPATNDIGLIELPDGRRLAIAIFITDSSTDEATRDKVAARIARLVYDSVSLKKK